MSLKYKYKAFGIVFYSEFEIPELLKSENKADVFIKVGETPTDLENSKKEGVRYQSNKNEFLLDIDQVARYYVKGGKEIIVDKKGQNNDKDIRLFLLGSVFGALFIQRGLLPIHGSAVKFGSTATIFTGRSGVGKSSVASYFLKNGYKVLTDDICVIDENLKLNPGFPKMKLWHDVADHLKLQVNNLNTVRDSLKKYQFPVEDFFCSEPLQPDKIVILQTHNSKCFEIEELQGIKKFNSVKNNTYRYRFIEGLEKRQEHFQILNNLLPKIKVYKVSRPQSPIMLKEFADFLTKELNLDV